MGHNIVAFVLFLMLLSMRTHIASPKVISILSSVILFMTRCHDPFELCLQCSLARMQSISISLCLSNCMYIIYLYTSLRSFPRHLSGKYWQLPCIFSSKIFIKKNATETEINHLKLIFFHRKFCDSVSFQLFYLFNAFMYTMLSLRT